MFSTRSIYMSLCFLLTFAAVAPTWANGNPDFDHLKGLVGEWRAEMGPDRVVVVSFELISNGTAVLERQTLPGSIVTSTIYHLDGKDLRVSHFCGAGNHPRMIRSSSLANSSELRFTEVDVSNLQPGGGYMSSIAFNFHDADSFTQKITWKLGDAERENALNYRRIK